MRKLALLFTLSLISIACFAQSQDNARNYFDLPVVVVSPVEPIPFKGTDGKWHINYHLFVSNFSHFDLTLNKVEVKHDGTILKTYIEKDLSDNRIFRSSVPSVTNLPEYKDKKRTIPSGHTAVVFFLLELNDENASIEKLNHNFVFDNEPKIKIYGETNDKKNLLTLEDFSVSVSDHSPIEIGPPLRGGPWRCGNAPGFGSNHQFLLASGGRYTYAQAFGIDFQKIDSDGQILSFRNRDNLKNEEFYGYGAEVLAVADGIIADTVDNIPDNIPTINGKINMPVSFGLKTVAGNFISLDLGDGNFAFYAHLKPGSIKLKTGDKVKKGQVIGRLGNSGNSVGPHLHFHIGNRNLLNGSEGVPFVFSKLKVVDNGKKTKFMEMPMRDSIVYF